MEGVVGEDGSAPQLGTWEEGGLVQTEGTNQKRYSIVPRGDDQPHDFCMDLVEKG